MSIISMVLVVVVAFLAGLEGILDQFQFHQPLVACTLIGAACLINSLRNSSLATSSDATMIRSALDAGVQLVAT